VDLASGRLNHWIDACAQKETTSDPTTRAVDIHRRSRELTQNLRDRCAAPVLGIEKLAGAILHLVEKSLVEQMQQGILVGKPPVKRADGHSGTFHNFGESRLGEALFVEYALGRVENSVERLLASRLLRRTESRNCHRTNSHPLGAGSPQLGTMGPHRGAFNKQIAEPTCKHADILCRRRRSPRRHRPGQAPVHWRKIQRRRCETKPCRLRRSTKVSRPTDRKYPVSLATTGWVPAVSSSTSTRSSPGRALSAKLGHRSY